MFILTVIPLHLTNDSDTTKVNTSNTIDVQEHTVMELEAVYTALLLKQYYSGNVGAIQGIDTSNEDSVLTALNEARKKELEERNSTGQTADNNSLSRLNYLGVVEVVTDKRIQDLQALKVSLESGKSLDYVVSGVDNSNLAEVNRELDRAVKFKKEIDRSQDFWGEIVKLQSKVTNRKNNDDPLNTKEETDYKLDLPTLNKIALSKRKISNLQSVLSLMSNGKSLSQLKLEELGIRGRLSSQILRAKIKHLKPIIKHVSKSPDGSNIEEDVLGELKSSLRENMSEQQVAKLITSLTESVQKEIVEEIKNLV